jgi:hypothetical protein
LAVRTDFGDAGKSQALRVRVIDLPAGHGANEGVDLYVGPPRRVCENSGQVNPPQPGNPPNFGCAPSTTGSRSTWIASLQTDPHYTDWHGKCVSGACVGGFKVSGDSSCTVDADCAGAVNVFHSVFAPSTLPGSPATFEVAAVADDCTLGTESSFSDPLTITLSKWGDLLGSNATTPPSVPNTIVDGGDIVGVLNKFKNLAASPIKARADIEPRCPDHLILGSDITRVLDAFGNDPYPFAPGTPAATCP